MACLTMCILEENQVTCYVDGLGSYSGNDRFINWYLDSNWVGRLEQQHNTKSDNYTITGLSANNQYYILAQIYSNNKQNVLELGAFITNNVIKLEISETTANSLTCYVDGLDSYSSNDRFINWYVDSVWKGRLDDQYHTQSDEFNITNLKPNTSYNIKAKIYYNNKENCIEISTDITILVSRPAYFSWEYPKISGGTFNLTAVEWNALTTNINAVREYKDYAAYDFTTVTSGDIFYWYIYNEAVEAIQEMSGYGTSLSRVSSGDNVTAACLNGLKNAINAVS